MALKYTIDNEFIGRGEPTARSRACALPAGQSCRQIKFSWQRRTVRSVEIVDCLSVIEHM